MFVSIILPVLNEAPTIHEVLSAVMQQDYPGELIEVIVADGMSRDGTREIVRSLIAKDSRLRLVDNPRRITPAGLNLAIRESCGKIIVRVDGHGVIPPNYVRDCVEALGEKTEVQSAAGAERRNSRGEGGGTGRDLLAVGGAWDSVGRGVVGEAIALAMSSSLGVGNSPYRILANGDTPIQTDTVPFWAIPRRTFERIGLFREEMHAHEDYEFNNRLRTAGGAILLLPWLRAKYYVRSTLSGLARQYWRYGFWKGRFLRSHPGSLRVRHLIPPLFVASLAACGLTSVFAEIGRLALGALLSLYVSFLFLATMALAVSHKRTDLRGPGHSTISLTPWLPVILATLHLCWGAGVWFGLLRGKVTGEIQSLRPAA